MEFLVELTARAERDLAAIYDFIDTDSSERALAWFNGLEVAIFSLANLAERGTLTRENLAVRQLLYGNKPDVYRVIYRVRKRAGKVIVLHIRHGARDGTRWSRPSAS